MSYLKNTAGQFLYFAMIAKADGSAITSGTVNGYRTIDGGTQAAVTGTITHKGNGQWQLALSQADTNGDEVGYLFTHTSGIPVSISIVTDTKKVGDLQDLSATAVNAEVDTALADYDPPTKAELDAGLAALNDLDATAVQTAAAAALTAYDAPTKAELDAGLAGLNDLSAADVSTEVASALTAYDAPTKAELDAGLAALNDLDATAVQAAAAAALTAYDPPTKAELDTALAGLNDLAAGEIADAVWDEALAGHAGGGSAGAALTAAGSAGDPWATPLPGAYGAGTAGNIIGSNLDAAVSGLSTFDPLTDQVDVGSVGGTAVTGPGDLKSYDPVTAAFVAYGDLGTPAGSRYYFEFDSLELPPALAANMRGAAMTVIEGPAKGLTRYITNYATGGAGTRVRFSLSCLSPLPDVGDRVAFFHAAGEPLIASANIAESVWQAHPSSYLGTGRAAQMLYDLNAGTAGLDPSAIADAIWDELLAGHAISGSAGEALAGAGGGSGSDPWATAVPGAYAAGTAGYLLGTYLDAAISSRSDFDAGADQVDVGSIATAVAQAIADEVLARSVAGVEDTASPASLAAIILATLESSISGSTWTIRKTGGATFATKTVTTDGAALPIVGVD